MAKILLAEDDDSMRHFLGRALERAGHDVFSVSQGDEALPVLAEGRFDLLLADIVMPEMDGIELARRAVAVDPAIRIMFITGFAAVALRNKKSSRSDAKVLSKPFHLRDLVDEIDKILAA
ncbi:MAG: response regulator [Alphaproteobacteria bacterium]